MAVKSFTLTKGLQSGSCWTLLHSANQSHVTARNNYLKLLGTLQARSVAFTDIKKYLLNEAKSELLYRKDYSDPKSGKVSFPPEARYKRTAWGNALLNFMKWIKRNYTSYGKQVVQTSAKPSKKPTVTRTNTVTRKKTDGAVTSVNEVEKLTTSEESSEGLEPLKESEALTQQQVMLLIQENWTVLGQFCEGKSPEALNKFNELMEALNLEEEKF